MTTTVRVRLAPAPSGSLHVGNARSALYNWLFARRHGGVFVLRIEDTDRKRVSDEAYAAVLEDLMWLGLRWDEGPEVGGDFGPYRQSERLGRYRAAAGDLLSKGRAYRCYCTAEELAERRKLAQAAKRPPGYDGHCRDLTEAERAAYEREGRLFAVRFRVPEGRTVAFEDLVRGTVSTHTAQIPDFVILRSEGSPTYMLAATVDDVAMDITHIIRGEDLLPATPRQLLMREAMEVSEVPVFGHLPLLVGADGKPLSKRWGDVAVAAYRQQGFLPEAMVNYLALLGWSYDDRTNIFSVDELIERFSLERVAKNPATFDVDKLEWLNGHYIRRKSTSDLAEALVPFCVAAGIPADTEQGRATLRAVAPLLVERLKRLTEAPPMVRFLFQEVTPEERASTVLEGQRGYLVEVTQALAGLEKWTSAAVEEALRELAARRELKPKQAFQPIRAAVTGTLVSPPLFESLEILGKEKTLARLIAASR
jgi:glutamyl-tRNA synthetase